MLENSTLNKQTAGVAGKAFVLNAFLSILCFLFAGGIYGAISAQDERLFTPSLLVTGFVSLIGIAMFFVISSVSIVKGYVGAKQGFLFFPIVGGIVGFTNAFFLSLGGNNSPMMFLVYVGGLAGALYALFYPLLCRQEAA